MRRFLRLIAVMLVAIIGFSAVACGEKLSLSFKDDLPKTVQVGTELKLRNYIEEDPEAVYVLYASYTDPNTGEEIKDKKQSSMTFTFDLATVYNFKVEMIKGKKTATATASIEALPDAPAFLSVNRVRVPLGQTRTFAEITASANILITPADLSDKIEFKSVTINKATFNNSQSTVPELVSSKDIAQTETTFTFTDEAEYVFDISATNKTGTAVNTLTVTTIDADKAKAKMEYEYDAEQRIMSWEAVENATAYRIEVEGQISIVTETEFSFTSYEDGEYDVNMYPVYGEKVYANAKASGIITVGVVRTPLTLSKENYTVTWAKRPLAIGYAVSENGGTPTNVDGNTFTYTLTGTYQTHYEVPVTVVALFEDSTTSEVSTIKIKYGTVTFEAWDLNNAGTTTNSNDIKAYSGIDAVVVGENLTDTFFMVEYTGKNVPNFAARAVDKYTSITEDDITAGRLWHNPGIFIYTSFLFGNEAKAQHVYVTRGLCSSSGNNDGKGSIAPNSSEGIGGSITTMVDGTKYIMIIGFEVIGGSTNVSRVTCYLMKVEGTSVTKIFQSSLEAPSTSHNISGNKAVIYPALKTQKEKPITFTYYPAKATLVSVVNDSTSPYKDAIKTALELN